MPRASVLSDDERDTVARLRGDVLSRRFDLDLRNAYYNGLQVVRDLGISIPPQLRTLHTVIGWPRVAVDSVDERLQLQGFRYSEGEDGDSYFSEWFAYNNMAEESALGHLDTLVFSHSYLCLGMNDEDPDYPLSTIGSPLDMAGDWNADTREFDAVARFYKSPDGKQERVALYLPESTVYAEQNEFGNWVVIDRDDHGLGVVMVDRLGNRRRVKERWGASEITPEIMSITDSACRTLLGAEVAREFYGAPQRYILGASESAFQDAGGNAKGAWETYIGRVLALEADEDGNQPTVGQFTAYDPSAYAAMIEMYGKIMVSQTGLPPQNFGLTFEVPASADAMRMSEQRLISRVERKQVGLSGGWESHAKKSLYLATGEQVPSSVKLTPVWRNPATPTLAAQSDAAMKFVQAGILPADSDVTLELAGFTPEQRERIKKDRTRAEAQANRQALLAAAQGVTSANGTDQPGAGVSTGATGTNEPAPNGSS